MNTLCFLIGRYATTAESDFGLSARLEDAHGVLPFSTVEECLLVGFGINLCMRASTKLLTARALRKAQIIRQRLGGSGSLGDSFPDKPNGMHWRTYDRLCQAAQQAENRSWPPSLLRVIGERF